MGTGGDERVHRVFGAHDPDAELFFPALVDFADGVVAWKARLELLHGLEENVREEETDEDAGESADRSREREPGRGQDEWKLAPGNLSLFTNLRSRATGQRSL